MGVLNEKMCKKSQEFICKYCSKTYKARNSLWYHEQKCSDQANKQYIEEKAKTITDKDELIIFLIKEYKIYLM